MIASFYSNPPFLYLYILIQTAYSTHYLFQNLLQIIASCYERKKFDFNFSTNLEFLQMGKYFYDVQMAAAMIDRIVHHGHLIMFSGESYRMENSLMKNLISRVRKG